MGKRKTPKPVEGVRPTKATKALAAKRAYEIYQLLLKGLSRADILQYALKQNWQLSDSSIDNYIARATAEIQENGRVNQQEEMQAAIEQLRFLYRQNIMIQDYKAALQVRKELNELVGLYPAKKHTIDPDTVPLPIRITAIEVYKVLPGGDSE